MAKREFLQLAHDFDSNKSNCAGMMASEKLDGFRAFWDGGVSRNIPKSEVPWANHDGDERFVEKQIATGLWTRYGNVIHAPDYWLDTLPATMLDGELYMGRKQFQKLRSICAKLPSQRNDLDWASVKYYVFDAPEPTSVFQDGVIEGRIGNKKFTMNMHGAYDWHRSRCQTLSVEVPIYAEAFGNKYNRLRNRDHWNDTVSLHNQLTLPLDEETASSYVTNLLHDIVNLGGEGLILKDPHSLWRPERTHRMLKVKDLIDDEAEIIGYVSGCETDFGSQHLGSVGSLVCRLADGTVFRLAGLRSNVRTFASVSGDWTEAKEWATKNPGKEVPDWMYAPYYPRGTLLTFTYREKTNEGIPREARILRK